MNEPTDDEITRALAEAATPRFGGLGKQWSFGGEVWHDERTARLIARSCLILGVRVTDTLTIDAWFALLDRVLVLERAMDADQPSA